ncbi:helix-turn-helix domain-containing protein [Idiomarina sp. HP20-50]|uniref:helix-turn-helix domain-containing protein n=1 Tax=Idiomarina sp. HP20-50 TaxID=3070813 RepID=UPI00294B4CE3|nr:helix-turn-helix domain-containing protein [Idiomarina sp. HP20-50]MDV6316454.1 helix-turn-helix domain-containing protein [Idiomarina sp. HP20-50]
MSYNKFDIIPAASFSDIGLKMVPPLRCLSSWVQCLWANDGSKSNPQRVEEKLYPDAGSSLTFEIRNTEIKARYFHHTRVFAHRWDLSTKHISVRFRAGGARALLGLDIDDLQNIEIDLLDTAFPQRSSLQLLMDTLPALSTTQQIEAVQNWLLTLSCRAQEPHYKWSTLLARASTDLIPPQQLALQNGLSRRTLERQLRKYLGFTPNQLHRFAQIRKARQHLIMTPDSLSDIALACGYFDQAHFTNAFREQALETPLQYRQRKMSQISNS